MSSRSILRVAAFVVASLLWTAPLSAATYCAPGQQNVVLFLMDDLGWTSLPFFNPSANLSSDDLPAERWRRRQSPTVNRLDGRLCAAPAPTPTAGVFNGNVDTCSPSFSTTVLPGDAPVPTPTPPFYGSAACNGENGEEPGGCVPERDILPHFGGIQRLAEEGTVLTRFYAASAKCLPSRVALMTGKSSEKTFATDNKFDHRLDNFSESLAQFMRGEAEYYTGLIGKWHVTETPIAPPQNAFDEAIYYNDAYRGYFEAKGMDCDGPACANCTTNCAAPGDSPLWRLYSENLPRAFNKDNCWDAKSSTDVAMCHFSVRTYADLALEFIDRAQAEGKPFFLIVSFTSVHDGHRAPVRSKTHYGTGGPELAGSGRSASYWAIIEETDAAIGKILAKIDAPASPAPLRDNTVVIFTSDQGPDGPHLKFGDPMLRGNKGSVYEAGIRAPTIVRACDQNQGRVWPALPQPEPTPPGSEDYLASHIDLFRTIADAANEPAPWPSPFGAVDGVSLYDDLNDSDIAPGSVPDSPRDCAIARYGKSVALIARKGIRPGKDGGVCGKVIKDPEYGVMRATSDQICEPGVDDCSQVPCTVLGKRCTLEEGENREEHERPRCVRNSDCDQGEICEEAQVQCDVCYPATWKLKTSWTNPSSTARSRGLFDLTTNPEEDDAFDFSAEPEVTESQHILAAMTGAVQNWKDTDADPPNCEPLSLPSPTPAP